MTTSTEQKLKSPTQDIIAPKALETYFSDARNSEDHANYFDVVDRFALEQTDSRISNGMAQHAVYLIAKLFSVADKKVRLYSDKLTHTVKEDGKDAVELYGHPAVVDYMTQFLNKEGTELEIVVENDVAVLSDHLLIKRIEKMKSDRTMRGKFIIKQIRTGAAEYLEENKFATHFMVADKSAYRFEIDEEPESYRAIANFGGKKMAHDLVNIFDDFHLVHSVDLNY